MHNHLQMPNLNNGKKKESHAEAELRRDLKKAKLIGPNIFITKNIRFQLQARHQLKQYEGRIKNIEEEHKQVLM